MLEVQAGRRLNAALQTEVVAMMNSGDWLRKLREELHLTRIAVERITSEIASQRTNKRYRIRRGRLTDIEERSSAPNIFEVESLSECYKVPYQAVLDVFGLSLAETPASTGSDEITRSWAFNDTGRPFSLTFQSRVSFDTTRLVTETAEELGVPAAVRQRLDSGNFRLGIIGITDDTMDDLVPGGSIVVIDRSNTTVEMRELKTIQERAIYFVWHQNGYNCSWCNLVGDMLFIIPHPTSRQSVMMFKFPRDASIIGRVVHVWPPLRLERSSK